MSKTPEGKLKDKIAQFLLTTKLRTKSLYYDKFNASVLDKVGKPDFICIYYGRAICIEVKRPDGKGKQSEAQNITQELVEAAGGRWIVADSFEEVKNWFDAIETAGWL